MENNDKELEFIKEADRVNEIVNEFCTKYKKAVVGVNVLNMGHGFRITFNLSLSQLDDKS